MDNVADLAIIEQTAKAALVRWQLPKQQPELIQHRENTVFRVTDATGTRFALRIHRPGYHSDSALKSELDWMQHLSLEGVSVPVPLPCPDGHLTVPLAGLDGTIRQTDLLSWLDGESLGATGKPLSRSAAQLETIFYRIGRNMAHMHNLSDGWRRPRDFDRHAWDLDGLVGEDPFWGRFWDLEELPSRQKDQLIDARNLLRRELRQLADNRLDYGLIHADLVRENILVAKDNIHFIDFDDAGFGWRLFDIATTLLKNMAEPDYPAMRDALVAGYREQRALSNSDLQHLPLFLAARSLTYLGWIRDRRGEPGTRDRIPRLVDQALALTGKLLG